MSHMQTHTYIYIMFLHPCSARKRSLCIKYRLVCVISFGVLFHYKRSRCNHTDNRSQWRAFFMYFFTTSGPVATIRTTGLSGVPSLCSFSLQAVPLQPYGQQVSVACLLYVLFHYKRSRCNHTDNRSQWRAFFM